MNHKNVVRLNLLFEKMVSESISNTEKYELAALYAHFINEGRNQDKVTQRQKVINLHPN